MIWSSIGRLLPPKLAELLSSLIDITIRLWVKSNIFHIILSVIEIILCQLNTYPRHSSSVAIGCAISEWPTSATRRLKWSSYKILLSDLIYAMLFVINPCRNIPLIPVLFVEFCISISPKHAFVVGLSSGFSIVSSPMAVISMLHNVCIVFDVCFCLCKLPFVTASFSVDPWNGNSEPKTEIKSDSCFVMIFLGTA